MPGIYGVILQKDYQGTTGHVIKSLPCVLWGIFFPQHDYEVMLFFPLKKKQSFSGNMRFNYKCGFFYLQAML